jgi:DUF177 domain-containing protein
MKLDLTRYRQPVSHFARTFQPEEITSDVGTYNIAEPVELEFDIHKDKDKFRLEGHLRTELELSCSRCLEPYRFAVDADFDQRYLPSSAASTELENEVEENDLETSYYTDDQIDLGELMREQFYLALPMKPLCSADCRGLCPQCGTNLNTGTCDCSPVWEDPRLAALKAIKEKNA